MVLKHAPAFVLTLLALVVGSAHARAEVDELKVAKQYGISYLPLMIMEADKLVEKRATAAGLGNLKVDWVTLAGGAPMNDAILSGSLHFASGGVGPLATIWARTKGAGDVKAVCAMNSMPLYLNVRESAVKSLADLNETHKIALPAVKVSIQAVTLQMAAEKAFGAGNHGKLDAFTIAMSHPDAQAALLSGAAEVVGHFSSPPFQYQQLKSPGIRTLVNSYDVLGGPATFNLVWTTTKFYDTNPKVYAAFVQAFEDAIAAINKDKPWAAQRYLEISNDKKSTRAEILAMLEDPQIEFTTTPKSIMKYVDFMHRTGALKVKPDSWKDMFFANAHTLPGS
ncbi:MAG TPA: ABC transporter substrate-binding protein [Hyphomicrobiaceae bacterium]|nr:ABC transporter substrate-binding protein [Hyphomicrobiaceae bacterium]